MKDREVIGGFVIIFCLTYLLFRGIQILAVSGWLALLSANQPAVHRHHRAHSAVAVQADPGLRETREGERQ